MECVLSVVDEGTRLDALVTRPSGEVIGYAAEPGSASFRFAGAEGLRDKLSRLVSRAMVGIDEPLCLAAAAALQADAEVARDLLAGIVGVDRERVFPLDIEHSAMAGSLGSVDLRNSVVVRADVGSRGWAMGRGGQEVWRGGFGEVLGDEGSAYAIGLAGIRTALRAFEKRHRNTQLRTRLLGHFGATSYRDLLAPDHAGPVLDRYQIAGFAIRVFEAGEQGDDVATQILEEAGRDLAVLAQSLINELDLGEIEFSVLPAGSVFRARGACLEAFMKMLRNRTMKANLVKENLGTAAGGILLGIQALGLKVRPETVDMLRATLTQEL